MMSSVISQHNNPDDVSSRSPRQTGQGGGGWKGGVCCDGVGGGEAKVVRVPLISLQLLAIPLGSPLTRNNKQILFLTLLFPVSIRRINMDYALNHLPVKTQSRR